MLNIHSSKHLVCDCSYDATDNVSHLWVEDTR